MKKILVIDDEELLRKNILDLLRLEGFTCNDADSGEKAIVLIREWEPDLILCDIKMPEHDGYWVLDQLKDDVSLAHIPFLFLTAKVEAADIRHGMKMGADDYLTKPFTRNHLLDAISARLKRVERIRKGVSIKESNSNHLNDKNKYLISEIEKLTKSEKEILFYIANGLSSSEIAEKRFNSIKTIENHRANIISKLGLNGHLSLVKFSMALDAESIINSTNQN